MRRKIVAKSINTIVVNDLQWANHITDRLTHFTAIDIDKAVYHQLLRQGQAQRQKHSRPDNRMEAQDILTNDLDLSRPIIIMPLLVRIPQHR